MDETSGGGPERQDRNEGGAGRRGALLAVGAALLLTAAGATGLLVDGGDPSPASDPHDAARPPVTPPVPAAAPLPAGPPAPPDLSEAFRRASRVGALSSLLVSQGGQFLGGSYWRGLGPGEPVNVKSASKSVLGLLVGIAIEEGHVRSVDQPIREFFPGHFRSLDDPRKRLITVGHLLTMQAGLATTSFDTYGAWASSDDWIGFALERPMECLPGRCWEYSTGNYHLLSAILTRATGTDTRSWAARELMGPLGIPARPWDRGPDGYYLGGNNMSFTPRELLRIGEMLLDGGRWEGEQVVPERWIRQSWEARVTSSYNGNGYGYGWWTRELGGERFWYAWGYGGQYLLLAPGLDLAVVATTDVGAERRDFDTDRSLFRILREEVVPEVRRATAASARGGGRAAARRRR